MPGESAPELSLAGRQVLITGARGFIGHHLLNRAVQSGATVHATTRGTVPDMADHPVEWHHVDLSDATATDRLVAATRPDVVFHLASEVTGRRDPSAVVPTMQGNLASTVHLLGSALKHSIDRVVLAGSMEEPGPDDPTRALSSPYAAAKWASSGYARMFHQLWGLPVTVLRIAMAYGPGQPDRSKLVPHVITAQLAGRSPRISSGVREVDWVYVDDVVDAFVAAAVTRRPPEGGAIQIGSGVGTTIRDVVTLIGHLLGDVPAPEFGAVADRPLDARLVADVGMAHSVLGWRPRVGLEEGLRRTIQWYRGERSDELNATSSHRP